MSTHGIVVWKAGEKSVTSYTHYDGYPSGLGCEVLRAVRQQLWSADGQGYLEGLLRLRRAIEGIQVVTEDEPPTREQVEELAELGIHGVVGHGNEDEHWYRLLHMLQGNPAEELRVGYVLDASPEMDWSWRYTVDVDAEELRVARYSRPEDEAMWPLHGLPEYEEFSRKANGIG